MVHYVEPDGDKVLRMMIASEGAPPPDHTTVLPLRLRKFGQAHRQRRAGNPQDALALRMDGSDKRRT
jgi:hypothetical protein